MFKFTTKVSPFFLKFWGVPQVDQCSKNNIFRPRALLFWKFRFLNWCSGYSLSTMYFFYIFNWRLGTFLDAWKRSMILSIVRRYFVHFKNAHIEEKTQTAVLERLRIRNLIIITFSPSCISSSSKISTNGPGAVALACCFASRCGRFAMLVCTALSQCL